MFFTKRREKKVVYKIAFCDTPDLRTKFGEDTILYNSFEDAEHRIYKSKACGWRNAVLAQEENFYNKPFGAWKIDSAWLVIEKVEIY